LSNWHGFAGKLSAWTHASIGLIPSNL